MRSRGSLCNELLLVVPVHVLDCDPHCFVDQLKLQVSMHFRSKATKTSLSLDLTHSDLVLVVSFESLVLFSQLNSDSQLDVVVYKGE